MPDQQTVCDNWPEVLFTLNASTNNHFSILSFSSEIVTKELKDRLKNFASLSIVFVILEMEILMKISTTLLNNVEISPKLSRTILILTITIANYDFEARRHFLQHLLGKIISAPN